jgi:hypothetical protein
LQTFIESGKSFVEEIFSARGLSGKYWVEDKDWDDVTNY